METTFPIAWFQSSRRIVQDGVVSQRAALLALQEGAQEILDAIVLSLLVVEGELRRKETQYHNAQAMAMLRH